MHINIIWSFDHSCICAAIFKSHSFFVPLVYNPYIPYLYDTHVYCKLMWTIPGREECSVVLVGHKNRKRLQLCMTDLS